MSHTISICRYSQVSFMPTYAVYNKCTHRNIIFLKSNDCFLYVRETIVRNYDTIPLCNSKIYGGWAKQWEHEYNCRLNDLGLYLFMLSTNSSLMLSSGTPDCLERLITFRTFLALISNTWFIINKMMLSRFGQPCVIRTKLVMCILLLLYENIRVYIC